MAGEPTKNDVALALFLFAVSSIGMLLVNKLSMNYFPLGTSLMFAQNSFTFLFLILFCRSSLQAVKFSMIVKWIPLVGLFTAMILTSALSLKLTSVSTVIIFRNVSSVASMVIEYFVRGVTVDIPVFSSAVGIAIGAYLYGMNSMTLNYDGVFWVMVNIGAQIAYGMLLRVYMDQEEFKKLSKYTMSLYNNLLSLPFLGFLIFYNGEHLLVAENVAALPTEHLLVILSSCACAIVISTSGFGLAQLVSATTFLVINNLTKFVNILVGVFVLNDKLNFNGPDGLGCCLALGFGAAYSFFLSQLNARKDEEAKKKKKEKKVK